MRGRTLPHQLICRPPVARRWAFCILLLLIPRFVSSQPADLRFDQITTLNGLSQDVVTCIQRDHLGYLWIGTEDGLNRYDGYSISVYKRERERGTTPGANVVHGLCDYGDGGLLVAMQSGLMVYDRNKDRLERPKGALSAFTSSNTAHPARDVHGGYWFIVSGDSLVHYIPETDSLKVFTFSSGSRPGVAEGITNEFVDRRDSLWVITDSGVAVYHGGAGSFEMITIRYKGGADAKPVAPTTLAEDQSSNLWVGTVAGMYHLQRTSRTVSFVPLQHTVRDIVSGKLQWDSHGRLWIAGFAGLYCLDVQTMKSVHYSRVGGDPSSLSGDRIYDLYCDPSDILWIGTYRGGLNKVDLKTGRFGLIRNTVETPFAGKSNDIVSVYEDARGNAWIANGYGGATRIDAKTHEFRAFTHDPRNVASISAGEVSSITGDSTGAVWIAVGTNLDRFDPTTNSFTHAPVPHADPKDHPILTIYCDRHSTIWLGVQDLGVEHYLPSTKKFVQHNAMSPDTLFHRVDGAWAFLEDREGNVWWGGWGENINLHYYIPATNSLHSYQQPELQAARALVEDSDGSLWVGTWGNGMSHFDPHTSVIRQYLEQDGLPNNYIKGLIMDDHGTLWISTEKGISRFIPPSGPFKNFDIRDGLQGNFFYTGSFWKGHRGTLYFGGPSGLNVFSPDSIAEEAYDPPVILTSFRVLDKPQNLVRSGSTLHRVDLSHDEDILSFEYVSVDFTAPDRNRYAYMLEGFDRDWVDAGTRRYASYTHLDPGDYVFRVKGTNSDGKWSEHIAEIEISLHPAYWQTVWFRLAAVLLLSVLLYAVYRYRLAKLLEIEHTRSTIATDLHDDIGATLTSIALFSDLVRKEVAGQSPEAGERLERIAQISRSLLDKMNDIVWSINPENDTLEDLLLRMKELAVNLFSAKGIEYRIHIPDRLPGFRLSMSVRRNLFLIYKESVHNILKHSSATTAEIRVVLIAERRPRLTMTVQDNGTGFDVGHVRTGNGLKNIEQRAKLIHAIVEIQSHPGNGTTVLLRLPLKSPV